MKITTIAALAAISLLAACASKTATDSTGQHSDMTNPGTGTGIVGGSNEDLVANVGDRVFFELNKSTLSDEAQTTLTKQAAWLAKWPQDRIQIAGNADDRGTEEFNLALGNRRANAAKDFLKAKGVSGSRITTISYGKDRPTALGDNEQAWAQNRNAITSVR
jgi:peptidoglycan-associated lipoprotein